MNLPALEAVLEALPEVDALVCLGDIVGYNPHPSACVDVVREEFDHVVQGNHDREVGNAERYRSNPQAEAGLRYASEQLGDAQKECLSNIPERVTANGILFVHSHPVATDRYVFPDDTAGLQPCTLTTTTPSFSGTLTSSTNSSRMWAS